MPGPAYYSAVVSIAQNEDWMVPFVYGSSPDGGVTTTPIDLTGSTLKMEIRARESDREVFVSVFSPDHGIQITNAVDGEFMVLIDRDRLANLVPGDYVTDLVRETPSGYQERLFEGTATVVQGTTR